MLLNTKDIQTACSVVQYSTVQYSTVIPRSPDTGREAEQQRQRGKLPARKREKVL